MRVPVIGYYMIIGCIARGTKLIMLNPFVYVHTIFTCYLVLSEQNWKSVCFPDVKNPNNSESNDFLSMILGLQRISNKWYMAYN